MLDDAPLISIILPVYNAEVYVGPAIDSVLEQTYSNWELIIINDGSKDDSEIVIRKYSDARIKYFAQKNQGVSSARNKGLREASGSYFCFLDADDQFTPQSLSSRLMVFDTDPSIEFVDGTVAIMNATLTDQVEVRRHTYEGNPFNALIKLDGSCFFGPSWMIKRLDNKIYQFENGLTHCEDLLFYMSLSRDGKGNYKATPEIILKYRTGHVSAMSDLRKLERGYEEVSRQMLESLDVNSKHYSTFLKKAYSMMVKSYLRRGLLRYAFKSVYKWMRS